MSTVFATKGLGRLPVDSMGYTCYPHTWAASPATKRFLEGSMRRIRILDYRRGSRSSDWDSMLPGNRLAPRFRMWEDVLEEQAQ
jgi:hypothetical protein